MNKNILDDYKNRIDKAKNELKKSQAIEWEKIKKEIICDLVEENKRYLIKYVVYIMSLEDFGYKIMHYIGKGLFYDSVDHKLYLRFKRYDDLNPTLVCDFESLDNGLIEKILKSLKRYKSVFNGNKIVVPQGQGFYIFQCEGSMTSSVSDGNPETIRSVVKANSCEEAIGEFKVFLFFKCREYSCFQRFRVYYDGKWQQLKTVPNNPMIFDFEINKTVFTV